MWIDNNSSSTYYGRIYVSYNDFDIGVGALMIVQSDDAGTTWTAPVVVYNSSNFIRDVQLAGSPGSDGRVYLMTMDEGGGRGNNRQNFVFYSTDGGATWTQVTVGAKFGAPGDQTCDPNGYFANMDPIWRYMGWGQPAAGPNGLVAYDYTSHGAGNFGDPFGDAGDIYFVRSTDYGVTWSTPFKLNTDTGIADQWQPSLAITQSGAIVASWYDRRNSTDGSNYEVYHRVSTDRGLTWQDDRRLSGQLIPQPLQPDPNILPCYAGDYNNAVAYGNTVHFGWTDGRVLISSNPQQDVFVNQVSPIPAMPVLYDQYNNLDITNIMGQAVISQNFTTQDGYDSQGADDFIIPSGQFWKIAQVQVPGVLFGPAPTFNVFLYTNSGNKPGTQIFAQTGITPVPGVVALNGSSDGSVLLGVSDTGWLTAGHYWVSVQAGNKDDFGWYFYLRTVTSNAPGLWQNPNDGFGYGCTTWTETNTCTGFIGTSDFGFRLLGYREPAKR